MPAGEHPSLQFPSAPPSSIGFSHSASVFASSHMGVALFSTTSLKFTSFLRSHPSNHSQQMLNSPPEASQSSGVACSKLPSAATQEPVFPQLALVCSSHSGQERLFVQPSNGTQPTHIAPLP